MKNLLLAISIFLTSAASAQTEHLVKHNMVLVGESEIFASHIVYKEPHNYQVILGLNLDPTIKAAYQHERRSHPGDTFIYLLDDMHIAHIRHRSEISGTIFRKDSLGNKVTIAEGVRLPAGAFRVLYFNELPLSLASEPQLAAASGSCPKPGGAVICYRLPNGTCHCVRPK